MNIIITGASRGIGYETAKLLSAGHTVIAISRNTNHLLNLRKEGNSKNIFLITFDFETGNSASGQTVAWNGRSPSTLVARFFNEIVRRFGVRRVLLMIESQTTPLANEIKRFLRIEVVCQDGLSIQDLIDQIAAGMQRDPLWKEILDPIELLSILIVQAVIVVVVFGPRD